MRAVCLVVLLLGCKNPSSAEMAIECRRECAPSHWTGKFYRGWASGNASAQVALCECEGTP